MRHPRRLCICFVVSLLVVPMVAGCNLFQGGGEPEELATPEPLEKVSPVVSATGEVVPAEYTTLSFPIAGQVIKLTVEEGQIVQAGDAIAELDTSVLDTDVAEAEAALRVARTNLERTKAGPREEEIEQAQSDLAAANARVAEAVASRDLASQGATETEIARAQADVINARLAAEGVQDAYDSLMEWADPERLESLDLEPGDRTPLDSERDLRFQLELAKLRLAAAEAYLQQLLEGPDDDDLRTYEARIWIAAAQRDAAQARLNLLLAGPNPVDIAVAEAEVAQAQAAVELASRARSQATLEAPFSGTVSALYIQANEWVQPGQAVLLLADLANLRVETTDLNEIDAARVEVGNSVNIQFDALPDVEVSGTVARIAPKSAEGAGVNYTAVIELEEIPPALRWGMTAFVDIEVD